MAPTASNSGIVTDEASGERHIPESIRSDGSTRRAIKIRPGYRPAEDVELYRARNAVALGERRRMGVAGVENTTHREDKPEVPGATCNSRILQSLTNTLPLTTTTTTTGDGDDDGHVDEAANSIATPASLAASNKNAKRREARKKAKATERENKMASECCATDTNKGHVPNAGGQVDSLIDREKKVRNLKKKLKQARDLEAKQDTGEGLLPEQIAKVIRINELVRELEALGFEGDGHANKDTGANKIETGRASEEPS